MASIRERTSKSGEKTWAVLYRHGEKQRSKTFPTRNAAQAFHDLVNLVGPDKAIRALREDEPETGGLTVAELAERFLEWKARDVEPRTMADYRRDIANYVLPHLGHLAAEQLDEEQVQQWVDAHLRGKVAPKTAADRHMLLHQMYQFGKAKSRRLVTHNPCLETELPRRVKRPPKGTTVAEWRRLLSAAQERNPDAEDLIRFLGTVGWRFSEGSALMVRHVDDDGPDGLWVDMRNVFRIVENRQVLVPDAAKSYAGFRRVRVPSTETADMIRRRLAGKGPGDFVFTNSRGTHWNQNAFLRGTWRNIAEDAGLWRGPTKSPTPHWLRHMAVAVLAAGGAGPEQIQRYIGHESIETTMGTYGGLLGGLSADTVGNVDRILGGQGARGFVVTGEVLDTVIAQALETATATSG